MGETPLFKEISSLDTERINPDSVFIDQASPAEILKMINDEDKTVPLAVEKELPHIEKAVEYVVEAFKSGGRLFYAGAGTSGRLGIVDASECPPTFGVSVEQVQGIIAGGKEAVFIAQEGAEDQPGNGAKEIADRNIAPPDVVCGIAASGRTPFVVGALKEARKRNCKTIFITTASREKILKSDVKADVFICPEVGPEIIMGSTRMKSGTAQKLVLNMLTTASMILVGKTFGNVMVDLQLTNLKLKERAKRIVMLIAGVDYDAAARALEESGGSVKIALVIAMAGVSKREAENLIESSGGFVRKAVEKIYPEKANNNLLL